MDETIKNTESTNNGSGGSDSSTATNGNQARGASISANNGEEVKVAVGTTGGKVDVSKKNSNSDSDKKENEPENYVLRKPDENTPASAAEQIQKNYVMALQLDEITLQSLLEVKSSLAKMGVTAPFLDSQIEGVAARLPESSRETSIPTSPNIDAVAAVKNGFELPEKTGYVSLLPNMT